MTTQGHTLPYGEQELISDIGELLQQKYPQLPLAVACQALVHMAGAVMASLAEYQINVALANQMHLQLALAYKQSCAKYHADAAIAAASANIH